jgi:hypothetical protein
MSRIRLCWLFGLIWKEIKGGKEKPNREKKKDFKIGREIFLILRTRGFIYNFLVLIKRIIGSIKVKIFKLNLGWDWPTQLIKDFSLLSSRHTFTFSHRT